MKHALVFVLLLATCAFARPKFDTKHDYSLKNLKETVQTKDDKGNVITINADAKISPNTITLDDKEMVDAISCSDKEMKLTMSKDADLKIKKGKVVVGGPEWGCVDPSAKRVGPFYRLVNKITKKGKVITLGTTPVGLDKVFDNAKITYTQKKATAAPDGKKTKDDTKASSKVVVPTNNAKAFNTVSKGVQFNSINPIYMPESDNVEISFSVTDKKLVGSSLDFKLICGKDTLKKTVKAVSGTQKTTLKFDKPLPQGNDCHFELADKKTVVASSIKFTINPDIAFLKPKNNDKYKDTDTLTVKWTLGKQKAVDATLELYKDTLIDKSIDKYNINTKKGEFSIAVNKLPASVKTGKYFLMMRSGCKMFGSFCKIKTQSPNFSILKGDSNSHNSITIVSPTETGNFQAGQTIAVKWVPAGFASTDKVKIKVMKDQFGINPILYSTSAKASDKELKIVVNKHWGSSTKFYILIEYDCQLLSGCSSAKSRYFAINFDKLFTFVDPTPKAGSVVKEGPITVAWDPKKVSHLSAKEKVSVSLVVVTVSGEHKVETKEVTAGSGKVTFPKVEASFFSYMFMIKYGCVIAGEFCEKEYSNAFTIPKQSISNWNYDEKKGGAKQAEKYLLNLSCEECSLLTTGPLCLLCAFDKTKAKLRLETNSYKIICKDCYVHTDIIASGVQLDIGSILGVKVSAITMEGKIKGNMDFSLQWVITSPIAWSKDIKLAFYPLFPGGSIKIAGVTINFYGELQLNLSMSASIAGAITVDFGGDFNTHFNLAITDGKHVDTKYKEKTFNAHKTNLTLEVQALAVIGIKPAIEFNILGQVRLIVQIMPNFKLTANFRLPPTLFPPKDASAKSYFGVKGYCNTEHRAEYEFSFNLDYMIYVSVGPIVLYRTPSQTIYTFSIIQGCLFPKGQKGSTDVVLKTDSTLTSLKTTKDKLEAKLSTAIQGMLKVEADRIGISISSSTKGLQITISAFQPSGQKEKVDLSKLSAMMKTGKNEISNILGKVSIV